jgi:hypothetical protein
MALTEIPTKWDALVYLPLEDRNKDNLQDFCGLKEGEVMDAVQNTREKDCCLLDMVETFNTLVMLVLSIDKLQL